jgi:FAD/FMN-containing dehydrogenase
MSQLEDLKSRLRGDVTEANDILTKYSRDTSVFEERPNLVVFPKDKDDVVKLVSYVHEERKNGTDISVTARAAGTCMSGGPLTPSILAVFTKYMNHLVELTDHDATVEPGMYYRDFEKETLKKNLLLPSYPASKGLCALGGIVNNNSGGERSLRYGKTDKYVEEINTVLSDGSVATFKALTQDELQAKKAEYTLEGEIYRKMDELISNNKELIKNAKPKVSKNSAGYALWDVVDEEKGTFDLSKVVTGAQGTLALMTSAKLALVTPKEHRAMLIVFLKDLEALPEIVRRVLKFNPESFESYDDHTFKLALRFLPKMIGRLGLFGTASLGISFLPEVGMVLTGGVPKLILMAEFAEDTNAEALRIALLAKESLKDLKLNTRIAKNEREANKYWIVRRESFSLLRQSSRGLYASAFIDDFVVNPDTYPQFIPELNTLLGQYDIIYTIAGHIGNGNFHIIPLMDLTSEKARNIILELSEKVYELIAKYHGSITGEHNDGIIRTPFLEMMFGREVCDLFGQTKHIFDPLSVFNPNKKVGGTKEDIKRLMSHHAVS